MKPGSVPTARVGPIIGALVEERWPARLRPDNEDGGYDILAEKVGCHRDAIYFIVEQRYEYVGFDLADKLLCALGRWDMWHGELEDIYPTKFKETCAAPGCSRQFWEYHRGGKPKRTCSKRCRARLDSVQLGRVRAGGARVMGRCNEGHRFTPDNTLWSGGYRRCRICASKAHAARMMNPEYREKRRVASQLARDRKKTVACR